MTSPDKHAARAIVAALGLALVLTSGAALAEGTFFKKRRAAPAATVDTGSAAPPPATRQEPAPPTPEPQVAQPAPAPPLVATAPPATPTPAPSSAPPMAAPVPSPQPPPAAVIQGAVQQVPNTDTLVVAGRRIRLAGVSGEPAMAAGLRGWLQSQGNQVRCTPTGQAYTCTTPGDLDVGRIVVFNGAGRAAADASQDYLDAEAQARSRGVGVWGR